MEAGIEEPLQIELPYGPRKHFLPVHASRKRFKLIIAHRRCGKTVALVNTLIVAALNNKRREPPPRYGYVAPSFEMAKDLAWSYMKQFTQTVPGMNFLEGELTAVFPNGATIRLYGGALAFERMRGLYFDGVILDEYAMLHPQAFTSVVRPCLADYRGFCIVSGTASGQDHFFDLKNRVEEDPNWEVFEIPITATGNDALSPKEVDEMRRDMSAAEFAREMLCSFEAPVEGAYYEDALNALAAQNRVTKVGADLNSSVITAWDLGIADFQCIWLFQFAGREIHWLEYIEDRGKRLSYYTDLLALKARTGGFTYRAHLLPHDVEIRELATGRSRRQELVGLLTDPVITVPQHSPEDGIAAARGVLGISWFDETKTRRGLARLRSYRRGRTGTPVHDDASHGADAFRTGAVGIPLVSGSFGKHGAGGRLRRRLRGLV
jgi:phage terminase large subunit